MCVDSTVLMHGLIQHTSNAQQAFSSLSTPTLQNALPALEKMCHGSAGSPLDEDTNGEAQGLEETCTTIRT
jgi:hypothetical protein